MLFSSPIVTATFLFLLCTGSNLLYTSSASQSVGVSYTNWDGIKQCTPTGYFTPSDENEISHLVKYSASAGTHVKVVGGGLSFSGVQMTEGGHIISLDKMNKILNVTYLSADDHSDGALVEVQAGIRLRELCRGLEAHNLAMPNLGATATQSVVGAMATGTHGTGLALGAVATQIQAMRIIDAQGQLRVASPTENVDLFDAARVGMGAVGIISSITIKAVPQWKMKKYSLDYSLEQLFVDLPFLMKEHPRLQWSWVPYTNSASVLIRDDVPDTADILPSGVDGGCWSNTQSTAECTDLSYKTLTDSLPHYLQRSLYTEMEMFIPVEHTETAVKDFIAFMKTVEDKHNPSITLSGMVRYVAGDEIFMSPMFGRDTAVISFIVLGDKEVTGDQAEFEMYARALEDICESRYSGRPHWGKVNYATVESIAKGYPDTMDKFNTVRNYMDPQGIFLNEYLEERIIAE